MEIHPLTETQIKDLKAAADYLKTSLMVYGGRMVGEASRLGGLDFYKWQKIIDQIIANADRIAFGEKPVEIDHGYDLDDVLGRDIKKKPTLFIEK